MKRMDFNFISKIFNSCGIWIVFFLHIIEASNIGDPDTLSIVLDKEATNLQDFIQILDPPAHLHGTYVTVEYRCTDDSIVGVEVLARTDDTKTQLILMSKTWKCKPNTGTLPKKKRVKLKLPKEFKYNYNYFNKVIKFASGAKLRAWILNEEFLPFYKHYGSGFDRAEVKVSHNAVILPPFSRPYVYVCIQCRKWSWDVLRAITSKNIPKCPVEKETVKVIQYPVALNGLPYGIFRTFAPYNNTELEGQRQRLLTSPRFTVALWLHILEYCPGPDVPGRFCSIMFHMSPTNEYMTPLLFLTPDEIDTVGHINHSINDKCPQWSETVENDYCLVDRNRCGRNDNCPWWTEVVDGQLSFLQWTITINHGKNFNETIETDFFNPRPVYLDDTAGFFVFGGAESTKSFKGYFGEATFYRGHDVDSKTIPFPSCYHPMFELNLTSRDMKCQSFLDWIDYKEQVFKELMRRMILKRSCANTLLTFLGYQETVSTSRNVCDAHRHRRSKLWTIARNMTKALVAKGIPVKHMLIGDRLYANATVMIESGIENIPSVFPLLKQAACSGNLDAMYTVAVILNNGIYSRTDEIQANAYLMKAALEKHRLSTLALGHKHRYGIDGVPQDLEASFVYHKYVADTTKEDKELHKDTDVFTESVRLTDELALKEQTDEEGDLFNWIKHQAKQGVLSAQTQAGRALYWGSQGLKRNLKAAIEYYRMSAETEDPQSMYDYGVVLMRGHGTKRDVNEGLNQIRKSAQKQNPAALNALGWYALNHEKDFALAADYFEQAHAAGNPDGTFHLGSMYFHGLYPGKARDRDKALELFAKAGSQGQIDAGVAFSHLIMLGTPGTPRNTYLAAEWARFIAEKNPAIGYVLRKAIHAYRREYSDVSLFYYFIAAEAGLEVASFNVAWLCEENKNGITSFIEKDCQWRHYNLSVSREIQFVDPYALIKMGDYYWYGCSGEKDSLKASNYYAEAARKQDPQAMFNLGFMIEEGARIPRSILNKVPIPTQFQRNNVTMLEYIYTRCKESPRSEAFLPCRIALWRVHLLEFWKRYRTAIEVSGMAGVAAMTAASIYLVGYTHLRRRNNDLTDTI